MTEQTPLSSSPSPAASGGTSPSASPSPPATGAASVQTTTSPASPTPTPSPSPTPTSRPSYVPENFWADGKVKETEFSEHINQLAARVAAEDSRKLTLPQTPDAYKVELPSDFKVPEGVKFEFNTTDPLLAQAKSVYHDIQTGKLSGQEGFSKLLGLYAGAQVTSQAQVDAARNTEMSKLGATADARLNAVYRFYSAYLGEAEAKLIASRTFTAADVVMHEKLMAKVGGSGAFSTSGREPPSAPGRLSNEEYARLSPARKLDYNRQWDQSKMPDWRDPRMQ